MLSRSVRDPMVLLLLVVCASLVYPVVEGRRDAPLTSAAAAEAGWMEKIAAVDDALANGRIDLATRAWHDAYVQAFGDRRWESMVATGDAALRIAAAAGTQRYGYSDARRAYLSALYRARAAGSVDGVLYVAKAFSALGDRDVVAMSLHIAHDVALESPYADDVARVRSYANQVALTIRR